MNRVARALYENDLPWLRGWLVGTFDVEPTAGLVAGWLAAARDMLVGDRLRDEATVRLVTFRADACRWRGPTGREFWMANYTDTDWRMWFANRLCEVGLGPRAGKAGGPTIDLRVTLHVFFRCIDETPEQLARLWRNRRERTRTGPDTPGIERTQVKVQPVDRVALRVTLPAPTARGEEKP